MQPQVCPQCGQPRANPLWRLCSCGHDFGDAPPPREPSVASPPVDPLRYRTFLRRFNAGVIDGFVFLPVELILRWLFSVHPGLVGQTVLTVFDLEYQWIYSVLLHAAFGQTLGKMATLVKVLDVSETRLPTLRQALLRDIGPVVLNSVGLVISLHRLWTGQSGGDESAVRLLGWAGLLWFFLEVVTMLLNPKRRAFHDLIAGTVVVRTDMPPARSTPLRSA